LIFLLDDFISCTSITEESSMRPQTSNKRGGGSGPKDHKKKRDGKNFGGPKKNREITFDPEARKQYLRGFSERKKQRRAYGLAMQKIKDRKAKLQDRREAKQVELERIEQAEEQKKELLLAQSHGVEETEEDTVALDESNTTTITYQDVATQSQFGGQVIVTTTTESPSDESDDDGRALPAAKKPSVDLRQRYAGNVNKFMNQLKGNLPGKKKRDTGSQPKHKGKHGAALMKGMGGSSNLKIAQKALLKTQAKSKNPVGDSKKRHGGKRKR
jgi:ribosomal RNA-processing protein 17